MFKKNIPAALLRELRKDNPDYNECRLMLDKDTRAAGYHDSKGVTSLMAAAQIDFSTLVKVLVHKGASVSAADNRGRTALHYAACALTFPDDIIRFLRDSGADLNAPDAKQATPLHLAVRYANLPATRLLVVLGADTRIRDANGDTPLKLAERLSRGPTFSEALTRPVTEEERNPPAKPAQPAIPMMWAPAIPPAPEAKPLSVKELEDMKKALKASFRRATAPGAGADTLTIALTAQALLTVDQRLRDCARSPRA